MSAARIGRVRMKDTNVVPMHPATLVRDDRKAEFLRNAAASFDNYTSKYGVKPDAMVTVLGGLKQSAEAFCIVRGDSMGGGTSVLALAASVLNREIGS